MPIATINRIYNRNLPPQLKEELDAMKPFVTWMSDTSLGRRSKRSIKILISHTTLIAVPSTLIAQWKTEIQKFVEDGAAKYVFFDNNEKLPSPEEIIQFDFVLISHDRLSKEKIPSSFKHNFLKEKKIILIFWL